MLTFWEMSLTGGILIAAVVIIRAVAINRLPKKAFLVLWAVTLCRLLIPISIPSPASVYSAAEYAGMTVRRPGVLLSQVGGTQAASAPRISVVLIVWAAVAVLCALVFLVAHLRGHVRYQASLPVENDFVKGWLERHRLRRPVQVRYSDQITAPLTYGVLWPVILLPKALDWSDEDRLSFILTHELAHIRRFDALWKWLLAAALCLHWFNPLVWVMYVLSSRDMELSCDESVVRACGREARAPYALTLVALEEKRAHFSPLASSFSKNAMEERITAIMKLKKTTLAGIATALVLVVAVTTVFATSAPSQKTAAVPPSTPAPTSSAKPSPSAVPSSTPDPHTSVMEGLVKDHGDIYDELPQQYTQAQYDMVIKALKFEGWENMSIAEFNRTLNKVFNDSEQSRTGDYEDSLYYALEMVMMGLPDNDPNAAFLRNTVQASQGEYTARVDEVYSGKRHDPDFSGTAERFREEDIFGEHVRTNYIQAHYDFTYRILDQNALTVKERDQFLQDVMQGAQDYLDGKTIGELIDDSNAEQSFKTALEAAGKAASNSHIEFTGCEVSYYEEY